MEFALRDRENARKKAVLAGKAWLQSEIAAARAKVAFVFIGSPTCVRVSALRGSWAAPVSGRRVGRMAGSLVVCYAQAKEMNNKKRTKLAFNPTAAVQTTSSVKT
jgi:hypothetical protein